MNNKYYLFSLSIVRNKHSFIHFMYLPHYIVFMLTTKAV